MYIGNGVTKNFPIPDGHDGSIVALVSGNGKGLLATPNDDYVIKNGCVCFHSAVPSGVKVTFDESDITEFIDESRKQVIIYSDGSTKEVEENPHVLLEEARNVLTDCILERNELNYLINATKKYLQNITVLTEKDLAGRLESYQTLADKAVLEASLDVKKKILEEWLPIFERTKLDKKLLEDTFNSLMALSTDIEGKITKAANSAATAVAKKCEKAIQSTEEIKEMKPVINAALLDAQEQIKRTAKDAAREIEYQSQKEFEEIKALRIKMESDYELLNERINNRIKILGGD